MLPDGIASYVVCCSGDKNYCICDWYFCHWEPDVVRLILFIYCGSWCYRPNMWWEVVSHISSEVMRLCTKVSSWYLPICLFRDGSLTLISIASLMDLTMLCPLCPLTEIFNGYVMTSGVVMVMNGWGGLHKFSEPVCRCSASLLYAFFLAVHPAIT